MCHGIYKPKEKYRKKDRDQEKYSRTQKHKQKYAEDPTVSPRQEW